MDEFEESEPESIEIENPVEKATDNKADQILSNQEKIPKETKSPKKAKRKTNVEENFLTFSDSEDYDEDDDEIENIDADLKTEDDVSNDKKEDESSSSSDEDDFEDVE